MRANARLRLADEKKKKETLALLWRKGRSQKKKITMSGLAGGSSKVSQDGLLIDHDLRVKVPAQW